MVSVITAGVVERVATQTQVLVPRARNPLTITGFHSLDESVASLVLLYLFTAK